VPLRETGLCVRCAALRETGLCVRCAAVRKKIVAFKELLRPEETLRTLRVFMKVLQLSAKPAFVTTVSP